MLTVFAIAVFAGLLICAACFDITRLLIPNWISIAMAGAYPALALLHGAAITDIGVHLLFGFGALAVGFFLFNANIIGGGDAKLLAATSMWTGVAAFAPFILWMAMSGGVMALVLIQARRWVPHIEGAPAFVNRLLTRGSGIPYGVAIMAGGLMAIPHLPFVLAR